MHICQFIWLPTAQTPQAASIVILHDELHKHILLLFRQADAYLMQFIFQVLNDFRCVQTANIFIPSMLTHDFFRFCTAVFFQQSGICGRDFFIILQIKPLAQIEERKRPQFFSAIFVGIRFVLSWRTFRRGRFQISDKIHQ